MTDANRQLVRAASYEPFGKPRITTELVVNNFRFPGQYEDRESGMSYNWGAQARCDKLGDACDRIVTFDEHEECYMNVWHCGEEADGICFTQVPSRIAGYRELEKGRLEACEMMHCR